MEVLETDLKQRQFDGKWQLWYKFADVENAYEYINEVGSRVVLVPEKWVVAGVYDYLMTVED